MSETDYQALFERCTATESSLDKELALAKLQQIVYLFPVKRFGSTWDVAGDFYLFAQKHIETILKGYRERQHQVSFQLYLSVKLRSLFRNFLRRRKSERDAASSPVEWDDQMTLSIVPRDFYSNRRILCELHRALSGLEFLEQVTLKLYYSLPLTIGNIRDLARLRGSLKAVFHNYRDYLNEQQKSHKKLEQQLARADKQLETIANRARGLKEKISAEQMRREKIKKLLPFVGYIKMGTIAALLGEHQSTTSRRLKSAEQHLRTILSKNLGIKLID